jgi:hypothetical protein
MTEEKIDTTLPIRRLRKSKTTFEMCVRDAKKCEYISEWYKKYPVTYRRAVKKNWLNFITEYAHIKRKKKLVIRNSDITYEMCLADAKKHNVTSEWIKYDNKTYRIAIKYNWIDKILVESGLNSNHREKKAKGIIKRVNRVTFEMCVEDAIQCESIVEWQKKFAGTYSVAHTNEWIDTVIEKVGIKRLRNIKKGYDLESAVEVASRYETIKEWQHDNTSSYHWAQREGYLETIKSRVNFRPGRFDRDYTIYECTQDAKKYNSTSKWEKSGELYHYAKYKNWIDTITERVGFQRGSPKKHWWYEM